MFSWLVSGPQAAEKILDGTIKGIDALVYTDEEKAAMRQKAADNWLELQKALGEETTVRSVARRALALLVTVPFVLMIVAAAVLYKIDGEYAKFLVSLAEGQFGWLVMGVMAFYFGTHLVRSNK
jgi:hypothetical protein